MMIWRGLGIDALVRAMRALAGDEGTAKPASPPPPRTAPEARS